MSGKKRSPIKDAGKGTKPGSLKSRKSINANVEAVMASLERLASQRIRNEMASRYGIQLPDPSMALGVKMSAMQALSKKFKGKDARVNHALALALWKTGYYEARTVAALIEAPELVTSAQMDRWCRDFDNWAICDTVCFKLFDRVETDLAFRKVVQWADSRKEFVKRAAFALLASLALHDKTTEDEPFTRCWPLIQRAAEDDRNFVRKGVSWALRSVGRRSRRLRAEAITLSGRLADSPNSACRWVGKDALRDLNTAGARSQTTQPS